MRFFLPKFADHADFDCGIPILHSNFDDHTQFGNFVSYRVSPDF